MQKFELFEEHFWQPLSKFGLKGAFWNLSPKAIIFTWIVLFILLIVSIIARILIQKKDSFSGFLVLDFVRSFENLITQTLGQYSFKHFAFITSLFIFIVTCNILSLIPWLEEPTADVSTTLALGIISFLYVQMSSIQARGFKGYIKEYFSPFFLLFPLNVIGELAKVVSISFRLFGNIFGGAIISRLWLSAIAGSIIKESLALGVNLIIVFFFVLFEGFIQAFVFSMLTLTYLSIAISQDHGE